MRLLVAFLLFCALYSVCVFPIKTIGKQEFPADLKEVFTDYGDNATQRYLGKDILGRDIVEIVSSYGNKYIYAMHTDASGMRWQVLKDSNIGQEVPFVNVIDNNGTVVHYHPDTIKERDLDKLVSAKNVLYPPDDLPLSEKFVTDTELFPQQSTKREDQSFDIPIGSGVKATNDSIDGSIPDVPALSQEDASWWPYIALGGTIGLWVYGVYYLITTTSAGARYLRRTDLWSMWRSEESYEALLMVEPQHLVDSLIQDITVSYHQDDNPVARFFEDVQQEYDTLLRWLQFRNTISSFYLSPGGAYDMLEKRLMLLDHMRKVVHYWQAQQIANKSVS